MKTEKKHTSFSEKIVNFDFDKYYTPKRRFGIHLSVWLFYTLIIQVGYHLGYRFSLITSILLAVRITVCNIVVFYLLFYFVIPKTINKNKILLFVVSIFLLLEVWLIFNHYFYVLLYKFGVSLDFGALDKIMETTAKKSIIDIIKPKNVLAYIFDILSSISPVLFLKIGFDLSKTYAMSVKANNEIERLNYENLAIENKFLTAQLNPHFLFNTLNNLYALSIKKSDIAPNFILRLSDIMRYTLYDASVKKISINKEIDFIENYFEMEKMRYPTDYLIEKEINVDNPSLEIEPLLFFVFIENAFKYGLKSDNPFLKMKLNVKDNNLLFDIQNDFLLKPNTNNEFRGIGVENIRRRLELLYPNNYKLKIEKSPQNIFSVKVEINLH